MKLDQSTVNKASLFLTVLALAANVINSQLSKTTMENTIAQKVDDAMKNYKVE